MIAGVDFTEPDRPREGAPYHRELVAGISARAGELGFKLERFDVGPGELTVPRLDSILHTRGISGLVLLPAWSEPDLAALDWSRLAGIYTDYIIERPKLHTVCSDQYRSLLAALHRFHEGFANLYSDAAEAIAARRAGVEPDPLALSFPTASDGVAGLAFVEAAITSSGSDGTWTTLR